MNKSLDPAQYEAFEDLSGSLEEMLDTFARAVERTRETIRADERIAAAGEGMRYSIGRTVSNQPFVEIEADILAGVPQNRWLNTVISNLKKKFPNGIKIRNNIIRIDPQSRREMTHSGYTKWLRNKHPGIYSDKLRATNNSDELLSATINWIDEAPKHPRKDKIVEFATGQVLLRVGNNDYNVRIVVGAERDGSLKLYDIVDFVPTTIVKK